MRSPPLRRKTTCEKRDLVQSGTSSLTSWPDVKLIPQTNKQTLKGEVIVCPGTASRRNRTQHFRPTYPISITDHGQLGTVALPKQHFMWAPVGQSWAPNGPWMGLTGAHLGMLLWWDSYPVGIRAGGS